MNPELVARVLELHSQGVPIRQICRQLKLGRDTVRQIVRGKSHPPTAQPPPPQRRPKFISLEPFKPRVIEWVQEHDLTAVRILKEIQAAGYQGGYTQLKDFVRGLRHSRDVQAVVRFEVAPGSQAQVDWSTFPITFGPLTRKLQCFGYVLSYSRYMYIEFFERANFPSFLRAHVKALEYTQGVPKQILYDNLRSVVSSRIDGFVQFNEKFLAFARYYGFEPRACRVNTPRTKGRVERIFDYVFKAFTQGRSFGSLPDLNHQARQWLQEANRRVHGTTGRQPWEMYQEEQPYLLALPKIAFDTSEVYSALCPLDGLVSFQGNRYSMPPTFVGKTILIRATDPEVCFEVEGKLVARHERLVGVRGRTQIDPSHYEGVVPAGRALKARLVEDEFLRLGPQAATYLEGLKRRLGQGAMSQAAKILQFKLEYRIEDIHRALQKALAYEAFGARFIEGILSREAARQSPDAASALSAQDVERVRQWIQSIQVQKRPLDAYREFLKESSHDERNLPEARKPASDDEADADGTAVRPRS